jgi:hypothetical protein
MQAKQIPGYVGFQVGNMFIVLIAAVEKFTALFVKKQRLNNGERNIYNPRSL